MTSVAGPPEIIPLRSVESSTATCPAGTVVVGGGWESVGTTSVDNSVTKSEASGNGWLITLVNFSGSPFNWHATAMCASH